MFITYESLGTQRPREVARHSTFAAAFGDLLGDIRCLHIEEDADNPGCADAYMSGGMIYCIEPISRRNIWKDSHGEEEAATLAA